jgi:branched-subunit amino acid transport protein
MIFAMEVVLIYINPVSYLTFEMDRVTWINRMKFCSDHRIAKLPRVDHSALEFGSKKEQRTVTEDNHIW